MTIDREDNIWICDQRAPRSKLGRRDSRYTIGVKGAVEIGMKPKDNGCCGSR
jgi:hypothetical protein